MDSFSFPFERMSGLDMHPLSFPISRLSPAKSSSSIDQYTHHHGKGDSAYSSFSGGSNAPDLSSPFFPDDLHSPGFHYADFKYMNSALNFGGESEPKSMDQLYRSMEALTRQCDQEDGDNYSNSNQQCNKKQTSPSASFPPLPSPPPPPPPARLESLVTVRNMENLRARQSPEGQTADRSRQRAHITPAPLPPPPPPPPLLFAGNPSSGPDTVYSLPVPQQNQAEPVNRDASAPPKSANVLSRLAQMYPSAATEHDSQQGLVAQGNGLRKRAHSAHATLPPVPVRPADSGHQPNNGSIQHKGHFYFVTGVCRTEGSMPVANILENSCADVHKSLEKERVLEQEGGVQRAIHRSNSYDALSEREHFPRAQELSVRKQDADGYLLDNALLGRKQAPQISNIPEPGQRLLGREITGRHHSSSHPIFYCGPEESGPQVPPSSHLTSIPPPVADPYIHVEKQEEQVRKVRKQPLDGLPREKINKETTPLLYHLTGANQMAFMNKFKNDSDSRTGCRNPERNSGALQHPEKELPNSKSKAVKGTNICSDQCEDSKIEMPLDTNLDSFSYPCNTLDDSYKKYYKEKLKDLQSRVLRETSFKRRDLQPHKIKQMLEQQPPVLQVFSSAQDPLYTADKLSHPWPQCQSQMYDPKSRNESLSEKTREIETTGGESGQTVRKEKGRRASQENDLECVDIWGEDARKDIRVEETRKDVRGEETRKSPKVAQPQVARIGGRKRLTQEQKKLCYSEPEKLHKLVDTPTHKPSHSLGNETEGLLTDDELGDQGLVATRKKLFEMRGRAMSASSLSKTTLKHLQHKALVAYMERKTGQKLTEPKQPCPQVPSQRHSAVGRASDCDPRLHHGNGGLKKKVHRPLSAGRILDSSSSSIRYTQFGSTISGEHSRQSSWKGMPLVSSSKAASVESLLDQPELSGPYRARSKSTPYVLQDSISISDASSTDSSSTLKGEVNSVASVIQSTAAVVLDDSCRVMAPRGKSMEELGVSKVIRPACLSRSSEQLDQLRGGNGGSRIHSSVKPRVHQSREKRILATSGEWTQRWAGHQEGRAEAVQMDVRHVREDSTSSAGSLPAGIGALPDMAQSFSLASTGTEAKPRGHLLEGEPLLSLCQVETPTPSCRKDGLPEVQNRVTQPGFSHEVALSHGVTTDPSLWPPPPDDDDDDDDVVEEEYEPSSSPNATGMGTMNMLAPLSQSQSPRATPAVAEVNRNVGEKPEGETEEESQQEGQMKDPEQEVTSMGGSQTEESTRDAPPPKQQQTQQMQWAALVEEVASADQSLAHLLRPVANHKTALMLMEQLLSEDTLLMEEHYKKKQEQGRASGLEEKQHQVEVKEQEQEEEEEKKSQRANAVEVHSGLSSSNPEKGCSEWQQDVVESLSEGDVIEKKRQLLACVEERLSALGEQRSTLQTDEVENGKRGAAITALVAERCPEAEQERYALFIGDLERVVSLLLCLSARLARVQNALSAVDEHTDQEEKQSLDNRHHLLCKQRDDAKDLKDNLDRRERMVSTFLSKHLTAAELQDYRRFIQTKASLLIRQKDMDERQRLGEEQREALLNSLPG